MQNVLGNVYKSISDYLVNNENTNIKKERVVMELLNKLSSLNFETEIEFPTMVVIGSQSSAKSSLLNSIMNMDILPTGSNMCSKNPVRIELLNSEFYNIKIGYYIDGIFNKKKEYKIDKINEDETSIMKNDIIKFGIENAGNKKNISENEIVIKLESPDIPNLTLIDLPGLVNVACVDEGQPENIKELIRNLISKYVSNKNTIILSVMPSRVDLEVDQALELTKEFDKNNERSIGILTKPDLMCNNSDISNYLLDNISSNLKLKYGYFAIKNKISNEDQTEYDYFNNHNIYSKMEDKSRLGIVNLSITLSNILLNKVRNYLPDIKININNRLINVEDELSKCNKLIPCTNKDFLLNLLITEFSDEFNKSVENQSITMNYGRKIKQNFIDYRDNLININILDTIDDNILQDIIINCEGNKMDYIIPVIDVLEKYIKDSRINPIMELKNPSIKCIEKTINTINEIINEILSLDNYIQYPNLKKIILEVTNESINLYKEDIIKELNTLINIEKNYIWTENKQFLLDFNEIKKNNINNNEIKKIIKMYYDTIIETFSNIIPKNIMYFLIKRLQQNIMNILLNKVSKQNKEVLLQENNEIYNKRIKLDNEKNKLLEIKNLIHTIMNE